MQRSCGMLGAMLAVALMGGTTPQLAMAGPGTASGQGLVWVPPGSGFADDLKPFEATHADAFQSAAPERIWLLVADRDVSGVAWTEGDDRTMALKTWCKGAGASFVLFEFDAGGKPEMVYECGGGAVSTEMVSETNGLASVAPAFEVFDDKQIRGHIRGGKGWCGDDAYCTTTRDFTVEAKVRR